MSDVGAPIGEVFVRVSPDLDRFRSQLEADLRAALLGIDLVVPVDGNTTKFDTKVAAAKTAAAKPVTTTLDANTAPADAKVTAAKTRAKQPVSTIVDADTAPADAAVAAAKAEISTPVNVQVDAMMNAVDLARVEAVKAELGAPVSFSVSGDASGGFAAVIGKEIGSSFATMNLGAQIAQAVDQGLGTGTTYSLGEQIAQGINRGLGTGTSQDLGSQIAQSLLAGIGTGGISSALGGLGGGSGGAITDPAGGVISSVPSGTAIGQDLHTQWAALTDQLVAEIERGNVGGSVAAELGAALDQAATHLAAGMIEDFNSAETILSDAKSSLDAALGGAAGGAASSGGGGGGAAVPIPASGGGSGGGGMLSALGGFLGGGGGGGGGGILSLLGFGTGASKGVGGIGAGMAGLGSIGGLLGLGAEHLITTLLGVGGSGIAAGIGGGLLGLGGLGVLGVGIGTDMAGIGQAIGDTKALVTAQNNLTQAVAVYGPASRQAAAAQGQYNYTLASFPAAAQSAIVAAANAAQAFHNMFNQATGPAEAVGAKIITQIMGVGEHFLPVIGQFALKNMHIIEDSLNGVKGLFSWFDSKSTTKLTLPGIGPMTLGTGGLSIFTDLEKIFTKNLPTAMHALTQGIELFGKVVEVAAQYTGPFIHFLDRLFTRLNQPSKFQALAHTIGDLIGVFRVWLRFIIAIGTTIYDVFKPAVGAGTAIIAGLTAGLKQIDHWLSTISGKKGALHNLFSTHLTEVVKGFGSILAGILPLLESTITAFVKISSVGAVIASAILIPIGAALHLIDQSHFATSIIGWVAALALFSPAIGGVFGLITMFGTKISGLVTAAKLIPTRLGVAALSVQSFGQKIATFASTVGSGIGSALSAVGRFASSVATGFGSALSAVGRFALSMAASLAGMVAQMVAWTAEHAVMAAEYIAQNSEMLLSSKAFAGILNVFTGIGSAASGFAAKMAGVAGTMSVVGADAGAAALGVDGLATSLDLVPAAATAAEVGEEGVGLGLSAMLGPIGLVVGAVTGLVLWMSHMNSAASKAGQTIGGDFVKNVQASNGSVNAQISTLKTEISHLQTLNGQLTTTTPVYGRFGRVVGTTTNVMAGARAEYTRNVAEIKTLTDKVNGMQSAQDAANTAQKQLSLMQQTGMTTAGQLSLANQALKLANDNVTSATKGSLGALNNMIGGQLSAEQSSLGWAQDLAGLGQSLSTNGSSIDLNTTAGQNNRQALDQVATAIDNQITQLVNQHASIKTINGVLQGHITQLQGVASQYGLSSGAVDAYLAQLHLTPSQVDTTLIQHGYTHAINQVNSLINTIAALHDKTITVDVNGVYAGVTGTPGNPLPGTHAYARGGIVTNTPTFLVGEDGSGYPEWVIPTNPQHRGNALNLLGSLHKALGFASGGTIGQVPSFVGPQVTAGGALAMSLLGLDYGGNIGSMAGSVNGLSASTSASITAVGHSAANAAVAAAIASAAASAAASASSGGGGPVAALGQSMAAARGWTGPLWTDLNNVANYESGWSMTAKNPLSGAYGIAQFINGPSEYAQYGGNATTATGQITGFLNYIASRYGTPAGAWNHELNFSNYGTGGILGKSKDKALPFQVLDKGGFLPPGLSMAFNGLGAPEPVGAAIGATGNPKVVVHSTVVVQSDLAESTYSKVVALQHQSEDRIVKLIEGAFE